MRVGRLIVVRHGAREPRFHCLVPGCGAQFFEGEDRAYQNHVARCSTQNEEALRHASLRTRAPGLFDPHVVGDPELSRWTRANRRAIIQGGLRM